MSENKFIRHLKGEGTAKSLLEVKNQNTPTSFANMPDGDTSNANDVYSDHRGNATGVLKGTENWKLNGSTLVESTTVYGDGRDFTDSFQVSSNGLWVDATCTFATPRRFASNTKFVLKLCGHDLETLLNDTIDFTLVVKFGTNTTISKTFKVTEQAFNFCKEFVIDFAESNSAAIKIAAGDTMQVQLLCADALAQAVLYNGMTVFTALQRRVDADAVASDTKTFAEVVDDVVQIQEDLDDLEEYVDDTFVRLDGTSVMTGPLLMRATESFKCAVAPYWDGIGFFKLNDNDSVTLMASIEYNSGFEPATTNTYNIGASARKWKNLYLSGTAYVVKLNNGSDITVPNSTGEMLVNSATHSTSLSIYGTPASGINTINIGRYTTATGVNSIMIGNYAKAGEGAMAFGNGAEAGSYGFAYLGKTTVSYAYQIGRGTNSESYTLYVGWSDANNYKLLDGTTGIIPSARLATTSSATEGQVLTLDSNLDAVWADAPTGLPDTTGATQGQVLTLDSNLKPAWADASGGTSNYHPDLFDWKWADHQLDDVQWLRADTFSWQSGSVYESAYQHLVDETYIAYIVDVGSPDKYYRMASDDVDGALHPYAWGDNGSVVYYTDSETPQVSDSLYYGANDSTATSAVDEYGLDVALTPQTETIAGTTITYYQATDGHKIVLADQESNVSAIYTATGVAWYYIIDTTNERFKLPRAKPLNGAIAGNGMTLGLTDGTNNVGLVKGAVNSTTWAGAFSTSTYGSNVGITAGTLGGNSNTSYGITTDSSKSGIIAERDNTDQCKYLYFYVGEFTQTALENTAGITAETLNDKVDKGHQVIAFQAPTAGNNYTWYRLYADGWVEQGGWTDGAENVATNITFPVVMRDTYYSLCFGGTENAVATSTGTPSYRSVFARIGTVTSRATTGFVLGNGVKISWQVSGMAQG